jgi:hypothetical protein
MGLCEAPELIPGHVRARAPAGAACVSGISFLLPATAQRRRKLPWQARSHDEHGRAMRGLDTP